MTVVVEIPDDVLAKVVPEGMDPARKLLEDAVVQAYREGTLTSAGVRRALRMETRFEVEALLVRYEVGGYTVDDFDSDMNHQRQVLG